LQIPSLPPGVRRRHFQREANYLHRRIVRLLPLGEVANVNPVAEPMVPRAARSRKSGENDSASIAALRQMELIEKTYYKTIPYK
jgi:hypothetical protein